MRISEKQFDKDIARAIQKYPSLRVHNKQGTKEVSGTIDLISDSNVIIGTFELSFSFGADYPYRYPKVKELSGIIPKESDWHCNSDGTLCITVEPKEIIVCRHGIDLLWFVSEKLIPHLAAQLLRKEYRIPYAVGEYSHKEQGLIEALIEITKDDNFEDLIRTLEWYLNRPKTGRNDLCFCGRNKKFKDCHELKFKDLDPLGKAYVEKELSLINAKE